MTLRAVHLHLTLRSWSTKEFGVTVYGSLVWLSPLFMCFLALCVYVRGLVSCTLQVPALLVCSYHCNPKSGLGHFFNTAWSYNPKAI